MTILKLPNIVYPLSHVNKTNEIIDVVNAQLNTSYTEMNPALTSIEGVCTWTVTHNLGTEDVSISVYEGDDEVFAKATITSENAVTITLNSSSNIAKDTYSVLILAKGGLSGSGGGSITVDSALSTTSENPVQNKVITNYVQPSLENFIPRDTVITVETDGSGDFTSIKDAVTSLEYKWSNGTITISVGEGTFTEEKILINSSSFNIPCLNIAGQGADKTIISSTTTDYAIEVNGSSKVFLSAFKVVPGGTKARTGIFCNSTLNGCALNNITIENCATAILLDVNTNCHAGTGITVKDCTDGLVAWRFSRITTNVGGTFVFNNVTTAWKVAVGGMIATSCPVGNITYTTVTTKCSQTVGTFNSNGFIGGTLQN